MKPAYSSISTTEGAHISGPCLVQIIPIEWLDEDPVIDFLTGKITTELELATDKEFLTLSFLNDTYDYDEKPKSSRGGDFYEVTVSGTINNFTAALQQTLETFRNHRFVARVRDRQGKVKLVGNTREGMEMKIDRRTTSAAGGTDAVNISLVMETKDLPPFYEV